MKKLIAADLKRLAGQKPTEKLSDLITSAAKKLKCSVNIIDYLPYISKTGKV